MIQWLVQTAGDCPEMAAAEWLSGGERARLKGLKVEKRRREWLLGRWTAKRLWQAVERQRTGKEWPLSSLVIEQNRMGAPVCVVEEPSAPLRSLTFSDAGRVASEDATTSEGVTVSISHCREYAFCAAVDRPGWPLGADMEFVEARPAGFVEGYFTEAEAAQVAQAGPKRDWLVTVIWSAKEAALKAVQLGLTVDSRVVSCVIGGGELERKGGLSIANRQLPIGNEEGDSGELKKGGGWRPFEIGWDEARLGQVGRPLQGWWRNWGGCVLTLAVGRWEKEYDDDQRDGLLRGGFRGAQGDCGRNGQRDGGATRARPADSLGAN